MSAPTHSTQKHSALPGTDSPEYGPPTDCLPPGPLTTAELAAAVREGADRERYHRIWHGMYRREDQPDDLQLRGRTLARTFPEGVLRGRSAALLWGDDSVPSDALPEIWLPSTRRSRPGRVYRYGTMRPEAITELDGVRVTSLLRTCRDLAADLPFGEAVVAVERMCAAHPQLATQLSAAAAHPAGRGIQRFVAVVDAIELGATSADESRARQLLSAAGYEGFGYGHSIRSHRRTVSLPLADPITRCMVIGRAVWAAWNESARSALRNAGWSVVVITGLAVSEVSPEPGGAPTTTLGPAFASASAGRAEPRDCGERDCGERDAGHPYFDADGAGWAGADVAAVMRSRWPATSLLEPMDCRPAADPFGMWAS